MMFMLVAALLSVHALASAAPGSKPAIGYSKDAASEYAGSDRCISCHKKVGEGFGHNPHSKPALSHGRNDLACESCHGAGKAHVESGGDISKIFNPAKGTAKEVEAHCLGCHHGQHANFEESGHGEANVSCVGCHSVHSGEDKEHLLKVAQPQLCFQCHMEVKPQFSMPFHHKVEEGLIKCSDCHEPHEAFGRKGLKSASTQDAVCAKCHAAVAGPFVYEHDVVKTEGCVACHTPHGGANPGMLNRANVNTICLQCHSPSPNSTTGLPIGPAHNLNQQYQSCTICHATVHGSNTSAVLFNLKD
jgi:DmsE family decaheme c-type cytochrome